MIVRRMGPWGPWWSSSLTDLAQVRREMDSLMERLSGATADMSAAGVFPLMNVSEDVDRYYVRAWVPGVDPKQLDVSAVHRTVTVAGTRESAQESGVSYHRRERPEGAFSRSVTLPAEVDATRVEARCIDGLLTVTLPKPEAARPRRVAVQTV